jgi:hypothetical protein
MQTAALAHALRQRQYALGQGSTAMIDALSMVGDTQAAPMITCRERRHEQQGHHKRMEPWQNPRLY